MIAFLRLYVAHRRYRKAVRDKTPASGVTWLRRLAVKGSGRRLGRRAARPR